MESEIPFCLFIDDILSHRVISLGIREVDSERVYVFLGLNGRKIYVPADEEFISREKVRSILNSLGLASLIGRGSY